MPQSFDAPRCPHCDQPLRRFTLPDNTGWQEDWHWACFNDECPYFRQGWVWMFEQYGVKSSYRYRRDPRTGTASPLAVWSRTAIKDRIIEDDASERAASVGEAGESAPTRSNGESNGDAGVIPEEQSGVGGDQ